MIFIGTVIFKEVEEIYQCGKLRENPFEIFHIFFYSQLADFFAIQLQCPLCDLLCCKKTYTMSQKKTFTGRKGSSLTGSSSQRPHPRTKLPNGPFNYYVMTWGGYWVGGSENNNFPINAFCNENVIS